MPPEDVACGVCGYRVKLSENYCWACAKLNPPLVEKRNPPLPPRNLLQ